jgi:hypothetical protein
MPNLALIRTKRITVYPSPWLYLYIFFDRKTPIQFPPIHTNSFQPLPVKTHEILKKPKNIAIKSKAIWKYRLFLTHIGKERSQYLFVFGSKKNAVTFPNSVKKELSALQIWTKKVEFTREKTWALPEETAKLT